jgi:hypothetical protein
MKLAKLSNRIGLDQGDIAGKDENAFILADRIAGAHHGMSGAVLFSLDNKIDSCMLDGRAHLLRLVPNHNVNVFGLDDLAGRSNHMRQQRLAAHLMQHFGAL